jgi:4-amino-4-deoxy-L-arabinose transferase-like glycosyltransferase
MSEAGGGDRSPHRFAIALAIVALVAFVIRVLFVVIVDPTVPRIGDASAYHLLAEHLAKGDGYIRPFDALLLHKIRFTAEYPPLFAAVLAIPARLGVHSVESQRIFVGLIGAGNVALIGLLGRRVLSPAVGIVAASLAAIYPMFLQPEGTLMAEALYAPLIALVLLLAYRAWDAPTTKHFVALGVAIGFATLARAEGLLLGIIVLAVGALLQRHEHVVRHVLVAFAVAIAVVAPWTIRNAAHFHTFVPVSNNVATLVDGANCDATYHGRLLGLWRETFSQFGDAARTLPQAQACFEGFNIADPHFDEAGVASKHQRDGASYARHHAGALPKVMAVRVLRTWGIYSPDQQINFETLEGRPREWQRRGTFMYWLMAPLAIVGAVLVHRARRPIWPLLSTAVSVVVVSALTYGQQRFRIAAEPAICVLAAVTLVQVTRAVRSRVAA